MDRPDIAPSTSPSSIALAVPVPWLAVPMARPFAIGFVILKKFSTAAVCSIVLVTPFVMLITGKVTQMIIEKGDK